MLSLHDIPGTHQQTVHIIDQAAADVTNYIAGWVAPFKCTITAIKYLPSDAVTGDNTNSRNLNVDIAGGTEIANLDFATGTNGAAGVVSSLTLTSTTSDLDLASGATLRVESEKVGTGLALPAGCLVIQFKAR